MGIARKIFAALATLCLCAGHALAQACLNVPNAARTTYTRVDGGTFTNQPEGRPKILVFVQANDAKSRSLAKDVATNGSALDGVDVCFVEVKRSSKATVNKFRTNHGLGKINVAFDTSRGAAESMAAYSRLLLGGEAATTPFLVYIDGDNVIRREEHGRKTTVAMMKEAFGECIEVAPSSSSGVAQSDPAQGDQPQVGSTLAVAYLNSVGLPYDPDAVLSNKKLYEVVYNERVVARPLFSDMIAFHTLSGLRNGRIPIGIYNFKEQYWNSANICDELLEEIGGIDLSKLYSSIDLTKTSLNRDENGNPLVPKAKSGTAKKAAPERIKVKFSAKDMDGNVVTSDIFSKNRLTVVNIWATCSGSCVNEMPVLAEILKENKPYGVGVVGIVYDAADRNGKIDSGRKSKAKTIIEKTGANYTHLIPTKEMYSSILRDIEAVSSTVFVDSEGYLVSFVEDGEQVVEVQSPMNSQPSWQNCVNEKLRQLGATKLSGATTENIIDCSVPSDKNGFSTTDISGNIVTDGIFAKNRLTMVNVWATWCYGCVEELPVLGKLDEQNKGRGFAVVGIIGDKGKYGGIRCTELATDQFTKSHGANYTHIFKTADMDIEILRNLKAYPTTIFVDSKGNQVGERYVGSKPLTEWQKIIDGLLKK